MRIFGRIRCWLGEHQEELYRQREDQRRLVWVCRRCDKVTRSMKLNATQMREFRKLRRLHG